MSIRFRCHYCGRKVEAPASTSGKPAKCPRCGHTTEVPTINPDDDDPLAGFDEFVAGYGAAAASLSPPKSRASAPSFNEGLPEINIRAAARSASHARVRPNRMQIVTNACGITLILLYAFFGLVIGALMLNGETDRLDQNQALTAIVLGPPVIIACFVLYFGPSIIAYVREHQNAVPIFIVNAIFGWMLIGWVASLAWAFSSDVRESRQYIRQVIVKENLSDDSYSEGSS